MKTKEKGPKGSRSALGRRGPVQDARWREKISNQLDEVKRAIWTAHLPSVTGREAVLRTALNEAEALAWQTPFPHLLFPVLAQEKAFSARRWAGRQRFVQQAGPVWVLAA